MTNVRRFFWFQSNTLLIKSLRASCTTTMSWSNVGRLKVRKSLFLIILVFSFVGLLQLLQDVPSEMATPQKNDDKDAFCAKKNDDGNSVDCGDLCPTGEPRERMRMNVILFGHGRSGTSFLGQLFNQNPNVFYQFEPLHVVKKMSNVKPRMLPTEEYVKKAFSVLSSIFSCKFSKSKVTLDFLSYYSTFRFLQKQSEALRRLVPSFKLNRRKMNEVCRAFPKYTVVKLLVSRLPDGKITNLLPLIRKLGESRFKVVHIIRDPRAVMDSQASLNWFDNSTFQEAARTICRQTEANLEVEESHDPFFRCNYKRIAYEELVTKPLSVARELYDFLGMTSSPEVTSWIANVTSLTRKDFEKMQKWRYSQIKNTTLVLARWKSAPRKRNCIVEKECEKVMAKIGYKKLACVD